MNGYDLVILDLDGTVYRGNEAIPGAREAIDRWRERGVQVRFLTNNSGVTRQALSAKLRALGIAAEPNDVYGTAMAAAEFLTHANKRSAVVVGEPGLKQTLIESGIKIVEGPTADAVVVGICRTFSYGDIDRALQAILAGAEFIATNTDATYPLEQGRMQPGAGAMVAAIAKASGVSPRVLGKPEPDMVLHLVEAAGTTPERTLVVGDRPETDLEAGRRAGCQVALVLTGVTTEAIPGTPCFANLSELANS